VRITTYDTAALQGPEGIDTSGVDLGPAGQLGVGAAWARVAAGLRSIPNQHDEIETWVVVAGEGLVFADAARQHVAAGTVVQFEPFETHFVENTGPTDLVFASFYWRDGVRAAGAATGVEHRRLAERPVFVFSSAEADRAAAEAFVRFQRMTGAEAWHVAAGHDSEGRRAFAARVTGGAAGLRADAEELHRLGRVPAAVKAAAAEALDRGELDVEAGIDAAFGALSGIERLGRELGRDWRADEPRGDWKIVHFLARDDVVARAVVAPALYRRAHPSWTPDIDYHVAEGTRWDVDPDAWQPWLDDLGARVEARYGAGVRDAGTWTPEQTAFLARLEARLAELTVHLGPDGFSPRLAAEALDGLVAAAAEFGRRQEPLAGVELWKDDARTAVALELAAARLLAGCAAPLVPEFAARLSAALGGPDPATWPRRVTLVAPGTRVALAAVREEAPC
jgi:Anticodon binding domain of methionyl tRNA ligase